MVMWGRGQDSHHDLTGWSKPHGGTREGAASLLWWGPPTEESPLKVVGYISLQGGS